MSDGGNGVSQEAGDLLEVHAVSKVFGRVPAQYRAISECGLRVRTGEFVCLLGPSGCGKTTLLNMLAGFEAPSGGFIRYKDEVITGPSPERMVCFQDAMQALLPWASVRKNIVYALRRRGVTGTAARQRLHDVLEIVGLTEHSRKYPPQLSGGMRQRLQIARALAVDPDVLLMDEPFGALDAITRTKMQEELLRVWNAAPSRSIVFVTHDVTEAVLLADTIAIMNQGPDSRIAHELSLDIPRPRSLDDEKVAHTIREVSDLLDGGSSDELGQD